jgi:hypothetical protein
MILAINILELFFLGLPEPTVLVVYKTNHKEHTSAVKELSEYLRTKNMKMLLYDQEISKQPGQVCNETYQT